MLKGPGKLSDKWTQIIAQLITAVGVIFAQQQSVKNEVAPLKEEQLILGMKVTGLAEKVSRLERKIGD